MQGEGVASHVYVRGNALDHHSTPPHEQRRHAAVKFSRRERKIGSARLGDAKSLEAKWPSYSLAEALGGQEGRQGAPEPDSTTSVVRSALRNQRTPAHAPHAAMR